MTKATIDQLSELHGKVAKVMINTIDRFERLAETDALGEDAVPISISPAFLSVAAKFLADNKISVDLSDSVEMTELQKKLEENKQNRKRRTVGNVTFMDVG